MNTNLELYLLVNREVIQEMERRAERQRLLREAKRARTAQRSAQAQAQSRLNLRRLLFFL